MIGDYHTLEIFQITSHHIIVVLIDNMMLIV